MPTKSSLSPKSVKAVQIRDDHLNGIPIPIGNPMGMEIDGTIGSGNGKEWESPRMGIGMALILMGINSHVRMQCLAHVIVTYSFFIQWQ